MDLRQVRIIKPDGSVVLCHGFSLLRKGDEFIIEDDEYISSNKRWLCTTDPEKNHNGILQVIANELHLG
jgi:hypothetical protein